MFKFLLGKGYLSYGMEVSAIIGPKIPRIPGQYDTHHHHL
jgi:hypothetical protein